MIAEVVGYSYGFLPWKYYREGSGTAMVSLCGEAIIDFGRASHRGFVYPELVVRDQYGWQHGCCQVNWRHLKGNVRVLQGEPGDPYSLGRWVLEADEVRGISTAEAREILHKKANKEE